MIKKLFLPDSLFPQTIIGIEIGKHNIFASQVYQKGNITKIQQAIVVPIEQDIDQDHESKTVAAISKALKPVKGNFIRLSIPNNKVIFKSLTLPFLDLQKIKMILGYEIESSLPFALHEAAFDFIVTNQDKEKKETSILVAVTQKKNISQIKNLVEKADKKINISAATVDLFGIYGICQNTYDLNSFQALIEFGKTSVAISHIENGNIKMIRNLPYGISNIIANIKESGGKSRKDILESLLRFGINQNENPGYATSFKRLVNDLSFTINSFKSQSNSSKSINNVLIVESAIEIKDFSQFITEKIGPKCTSLDLKKISNSKRISVDKGVNLTQVSIPSLAAAITTEKNRYFDLMPEDESNSKITIYQAITALSITLIIFASIYGIGFVKRKTWNSALTLYQKNSRKVLKKAFRNIEISKDDTLYDIISMADTKVNEEKKLWFSFSSQSRYSFLKYLQALSNAIATKNVNVNIKKLTIADDIMTIKGSASEFKDVYDFEKALKEVPLFLKITAPQERDFTIKITLKKSSEVRT